MHRIRGALKDYDWGIPDGLARWSGEADGRPQAELWFGLHPSGPSPIIDGVGTLADACASDDVPLLVKLLAAARPLSIQVHPDAAQAARGFAAQGDAAIYSDDREKTELLVALETFDAFCGWRDVTEAAAVLSHLPGTQRTIDALRAGDRVTALRSLLELANTVDLEAWNAQLPDAVRTAGLPEKDVRAYATVVSEYPRDAGVPATVLLDFLTLDPGDAVYVPAGIPHSYVRGIGLEVMTSSDNVLRLGLTGKPMHIDEAFACLDWESQPLVIRGQSRIAPSGAPFAVDVVHEASVETGRYRLVLAIDGPMRVESDGVLLELAPGESLALTAEEPTIHVQSAGRGAVVRATA